MLKAEKIHKPRMFLRFFTSFIHHFNNLTTKLIKSFIITITETALSFIKHLKFNKI